MIDKFKELDKDSKNPIPVVILCEIMKVSRSGYYKWKITPKSARQVENE